jgi:hypothetical protein
VRRFTTTQLEGFLQLVDSELTGSCTAILIGGGAVGLAYHGGHATIDLDLWDAEPEFWGAAERAQARSAIKVPVQKAAIAEPPHDFESRLRPLLIPGVERLQVFVPEPHDLVLMKTARGEAHDLDAIEDIHREVGLSLDTLVARFHETKPQVMGPPGRFKLSFQAMVARLFGEDVAIAVEERLADEQPL